MQRVRFFASRMVVVSGGASWAKDLVKAMRPVAPADESDARKRRRFWIIRMSVFLPMSYERPSLFAFYQAVLNAGGSQPCASIELITRRNELQCLLRHQAARSHPAGLAGASPAEESVSVRQRPWPAA